MMQVKGCGSSGPLRPPPINSRSSSRSGRSSSSSSSSSGTAAPRSSSSCAACKLLKRRCSATCIFAPHFRSDESPKKFARVHKVFGASNVSKILAEVAAEQREDAVNSLAYEAEARLRDPVYGCIGAIAHLQRRMAQLHHDLALARARLASARSGAAAAAATPTLPPPPPPPQPHPPAAIGGEEEEFCWIDLAAEGPPLPDLGQLCAGLAQSFSQICPLQEEGILMMSQPHHHQQRLMDAVPTAQIPFQF